MFGRLLNRVRQSIFPKPKKVPVYIPVLRASLLKGRKAVITGSTKGIGFAIAAAFAASGAEVVITGRKQDVVSDAVNRLNEKGGKVSGMPLDLMDVDSINQMIASVGKFDILVNNAGYVCQEGFGNTQEAEYDLTLDTNLKGHYFMSQAVARRWIGDGVKGNILNVCSASSLRPGTSPYILSKWGMRALTIGMAKRLIGHGIVVNGIAPGVTDTDQFTRGENDISKQRNPAGRMVTREEVANMAVVLVSDLCRMVVGDVLYMTGGGGIVTLDD